MAIRTYEGAPETRDIVKSPTSSITINNPPRNEECEAKIKEVGVSKPITSVSGISIESLKKEPVVYSTGAEDVSQQINFGRIFWKGLTIIVVASSIYLLIGEFLKPLPSLMWIIILGIIGVFCVTRIVYQMGQPKK